MGYDSGPSFETHRFAMLLRMRSKGGMNGMNAM
jgi:hypothetical protein